MRSMYALWSGLPGWMKRFSMSCSRHESEALTGQLGAVVTPDGVGPTVQIDRLAEKGDDARSGNARRHVDPECPAIRFVDHIQGPEHLVAVQHVT
jgi:hypothetical protein